jgi:hypothetical protein
MIKQIKKIYTRPFFKETRSIGDILIYRVLNLAIWTAYKIKYRLQLKETSLFIEKQKKEIIKKEKSVFVFANGPSMMDIDLNKVSALCKKGEYDLIAINSYLSNSADIAKPTYAIFADNVHFNNPVGQYKADIEKCKELGIVYFAPAKYVNQTDGLKYAYCSLCNIDASNTSNILKPAGYYGLTALFSLSLAKMLGYQKIYICGFDNSYFLDFEVLDNGEMCIRHKHYYDNKTSETKVKCLYGSTAEFFIDTYRHFSFLEKVISFDSGILNIARKTYLSTAARCFSLDVYKDD